VGSGGSDSLLTTTIAYTYDPLYRLTGASYSGAYTYTFDYAYDKVGNRTAMTKTITSTPVTTYTYDAANRMINAGGVPYTWNANGNLLNDGSAAYAYDLANRLAERLARRKRPRLANVSRGRLFCHIETSEVSKTSEVWSDICRTL